MMHKHAEIKPRFVPIPIEQKIGMRELFHDGMRRWAVTADGIQAIKDVRKSS